MWIYTGQCQTPITGGKGGKDRRAPFPATFKEALELPIQQMKAKDAQ